MRWLYHLLPRERDHGARYHPDSLDADGFVHASYADAVDASARLYFAPDAPLDVLQIDPRRLPPRALVVADTPRGPMPHVHGEIPTAAVRGRVPHVAGDARPDRVVGHRIAVLAFDGLTLLDLVGVLDPLSRIASMGVDPSTTVEVIAAHRTHAWNLHGATLSVDRVRPSLADFDLLVIPGGVGTRAMVTDAALLAWLASYPAEGMVASVCTGSLVLGAMGRLKGLRATTHPSAMASLAAYGAEASEARVVDEGTVVTAGGVTAGIDLGIHLVARLVDEAAAEKVAAQMVWPWTQRTH